MQKERMISVLADVTVQEVLRLMKFHQVDEVLVLGDKNNVRQVIGVVSDRDIALSMAERVSIQDLRAVDVMSQSFATAPMDTDFFQLAQMINQPGIRQLLILDTDGTTTNIVTAKNLLQILVSSLFELDRTPSRSVVSKSAPH